MTNIHNSGFTPIDIGSRLELMMDDYLIARLSGGAMLRLNRPVPQEVVMELDKPWEGNACGQKTIFRDGDIYRMYYRGSQFEMNETGLNEAGHPTVICYAESDDGVHWERPDLGLVEFDGSRKNNIVLIESEDSGFRLDQGISPFKDANPNCAPDAIYKTWVVGKTSRRGHGRNVPDGLHALKSSDGFHWTPMSDGPVIEDGLLDSQNLVFWDKVRGEYREYHRNEFHPTATGEEPYAAQQVKGEHGSSLRGSRYGRDIRTATSKDFIHWSEPEYVNYTQGRPHELYSSGITPYFRAPHIFVGFPTRYVHRYWSDAIEDLPELEDRRKRANVSLRYGSALTDGMFMSSRDGQTFNLWPESFIRPGSRSQDNWTYGDNFTSWGLVTTESKLRGAPDEISIYTLEGYWRGGSTTLLRHTLRIDGFASVQAPMSGGEVVTKPLVFKGNDLVLNFSASAAGSVRVEILRDHMDMAIDGFTLDECVEVLGDDLERVVRWADRRNLRKLAGIPVRLRFMLKDADLYSFRFR